MPAPRRLAVAILTIALLVASLAVTSTPSTAAADPGGRDAPTDSATGSEDNATPPFVESHLSPVEAAAALGIEPPPAAEASTPDPTTTAPGGFVEGQSVELLSERTEYSKTYGNPDGTQTVIVDNQPLHWLHESAWVDIDSSLVAQGDGFRSVSNAWRVDFAPLPGGVTISTPSGNLVFSPVGAAAVAPELLPDGKGVVYRNAWPNADLRYQVRADGVKEEIELRAAPSVDRFEFTTGGRRYLDDDGTLIPAEAAGLGEIGDAVILDSSGQEVPAADPEINATGPKQLPRLSISFDRAHLAGLPAEDYPVIIDPPWDFKSTNMTYLSHLGSSGTGHDTIYVGNNRGSYDQIWRSVGYFNYWPAIAGIQVASAKVYLGGAGANTPRPISVWATTQTTGTYTYAGVKQAGPYDTQTIGNSGWLDLTPEFQYWAANSISNVSLGFTGVETLGTFTQNHYPTYQLVVTGTPKTPSVPAYVSPATGYSSYSSSVTVTARNTDWRSVHLGFHLYDTTTGQPVAATWCGGSNPYTLTAPNATCAVTLQAPQVDRRYEWRIFAMAPDGDGGTEQAYSAYTSPTRQFAVDRTAPKIEHLAGFPSDLDDGYRPWNWNYVAFDATDALSAIDGISYVWSTNPNASVNSTIDAGACRQTSTTNPDDWMLTVPNFPSNCGAPVSSTPDGTYYLRLLAVDAVGNVSDIHTFRHQFDRTAPTAPTSLISTCSAISGGKPTVTMNWGASTDATAGIRGYSWTWNNSTSTAADTVDAEGGAGTTSATSPALNDGTWYFHVRALDNAIGLDGASNASGDVVSGPFVVSGGTITSMPANARFGDLWLPRLVDPQFMLGYLASAVIPPSILAEGFHALDLTTRQRLVECLLPILLESSAPGAEWSTEALADLKAVLTTAIFNPSALPTDATGTLVTELLSDPLPQVFDALARLADAVDALGDLPEDPGDVIDDVVPVLSEPTDLVAGLLDGLPELPSLDAPGLPGELVGAIGGAVFSTVDAAHQTIADITELTGLGPILDPLIDTVIGLIQLGRYDLCYETAAVEATCIEDLIAGVPVTADVTGDGVADVRATVGIVPVGTEVTFTYQLDRLSGFDGQAQVWIAYDLPGGSQRLRFGYDGLHRGDALSMSTTSTITVDRTALAGGALSFDFSVEHDDPAAQWALTAQQSKLVTEGGETHEVDPTAVSALLAPVPTSLTGSFDYAASADDADQGLVISVDPSTPTVLDAVASRAQTENGIESSQLRNLRVDEVPDHVRIQATRATTDAQGARNDHAIIDLDATAPISRVEYTEETIADLTVPSSVDTTTLLVEDLSTEARLDLAMRSNDGEASITTSTSVDRVAGSIESHDSAGLVRAYAIDATVLPTSMRLSYERAGEAIAIDYESNARLAGLVAGVFDRQSQLAVDADIDDVPPSMRLENQTNPRSIVFDAPGGIGLIDATVSMGPAATVLHPSGEHVTLNTTTGATGIGVRIAGLQKVTAQQTDQSIVDATVEANPGGNDLQILLVQDDRRYGAIDLEGLPSRLTLELDASLNRGTYTASAPTGPATIDRIGAWVADMQTGPSAFLQVEDLPGTIDVERSAASSGVEIVYTASAPTGRATAWFSPDPVRDLDFDTDRHIQAEVAAVPGTVRAVVDVPGKHLAFDAGDAIADLTVSVRGLWNDDPSLAAIASAHSVPAQWSADFQDGVQVEGTSGPIGPIALAITNHDIVSSPGGYHVSAYGRRTTGIYDASLYLPGVTAFDYHRTGTGLHVTADTELNGAPLALDADLAGPAEDGTTDEQRVVGTGTVYVLPETVDINIGKGTVEVTADGPLEIDFDARIGWDAAFESLTEPDWHDGVSVTDAVCAPSDSCRPEHVLCDSEACWGFWVKARLRGLPTHVRYDAEAGTVQVTGLSTDHFTARAILDDVLPFDVDGTITLGGIASPTNIDVGPIKWTTESGGLATLDVNIHNSAPIGSVHLDGQLGLSGSGINGHTELTACAVLDHVPAELEVDVKVHDGIRVTGHNDDPLLRLMVAAGPPDQDCGLVDLTNTYAYADLHDVPADFELVVQAPADEEDREEGLGLPKLSYTADADTLDVVANVTSEFLGAREEAEDFAMIGFGADIIDLAGDIDIIISEGDGGQIVTAVRSDPPTAQLGLSASLDVLVTVDPGDDGHLVDETLTYDAQIANVGLQDEEWGRLRIDGHVHAAISATGMLTVKDVGDLRLTLGALKITLGVEGDFSEFTFETAGLAADVDVDLRVLIEKFPYFSFFTPLLDERITADASYEHLYFNVLDSPTHEEPLEGPVVGTETVRDPGRAACFEVEAPLYRSVGIDVFPAPNGHTIDGFSLYPYAGQQPWVIGFFNPAFIENPTAPVHEQTVDRVIPQEYADIITSVLTPYRDLNDYLNHKLDPRPRTSQDCS